MLDSHQEIHATLDRLAERIGRPAALVDAGYVLVGHSANSLGVDPVRTASVLNRRAPQAAIDWLKSFGIETAEAPVRIPAQPKLHMLSRVIVPIRRRSVLLGFITTQDEPARLTPEELDELRRCATAFAELMNLMTVERESEAGHDNDTVDLVVRGADEELQAAVTRLRDRGFDLARPMHVIHALVSDEAVETAGGVRSLREVVAGTARRDTTLVAVLEPRQPEITLVTNESTTELELILGSITRLFPSDRVGVSVPTETVLGLANAYRQALAAAYLDAPRLDTNVVRWEQLGTFRLLFELGTSASTPFLGLARIGTLLADRSGEVLLETIETYLDSGADAQRAAAVLFVHRATLYQRLNRVRDLTGLDLHDGEARLQLHIELRLHRLQSVWHRIQLREGRSPEQ